MWVNDPAEVTPLPGKGGEFLPDGGKRGLEVYPMPVLDEEMSYWNVSAFAAR